MKMMPGTHWRVMRMALPAMLLLLSLNVSAAGPDLSVTFTACKDNGRYLLQGEIANNSGETVSLFEAALPWVDSILGAQLYGFRNLQHPVFLNQIYGFTDPVAIVEIPPVRSMRGVVDLAQRFPHIKKVLEHGESVVIAWVYRPTYVSSGHFVEETFSGAVVVSKNMSRDCHQ